MVPRVQRINHAKQASASAPRRTLITWLTRVTARPAKIGQQQDKPCAYQRYRYLFIVKSHYLPLPVRASR